MQLCNLLLRVWGSQKAATRLEGCGTAIVIVSGRTYKLQAANNEVKTEEIHSLASNQEETDTRVVIYMRYGSKLGYKSAIVRTPDSDIFFISLYHATSVQLTIFLDVGTGKQRKVVNISELSESLGVNSCASLLGLHVFTGEDVTSAFKGKGKIIPLRKLQSYPKYLDTFRTLGDAWEVDEKVIQMLEAFVCLKYGFQREKSVNTYRALLLKKMVGEEEILTVRSKVDLSRLPPCQDNLCQHIFRTNYRLSILNKANNPTIEHPEPFDDNQGWIIKDDLLEPLWAKCPILSSSLIEILGNVKKKMDEQEEDEEDFNVLEVTMSHED